MSTSTLDLSAPPMAAAVHRSAIRSSSEKWPLWWTILGVTIFCAAFWTAFFNIIF